MRTLLFALRVDADTMQMSTQPTEASQVRLSAKVAVIGLLVTAVVPVLFFRFPGPKFIPLPYEFMWAITEILWKPFRFWQTYLDSLTAYDLRQQVNPYFVAPFVNAPLVFLAAYAFLWLRTKWVKRSRESGAATDLHSVTERIQEIRQDYPAAVNKATRPTGHTEEVMQGAQEKIAARSYFHATAKPETAREDAEPVREAH
jgi:hypothetical protein